MTTATAKELRPLVSKALRAGFLERGWTGSAAKAFTAPAALVPAPLVLRWSPGLRGDTWGGLRFGGDGVITSDDAVAEIAGYPAECQSPDIVRWPAGPDRDAMYSLTLETTGGLIDPSRSFFDWIPRTAEEVAPAVAEFFRMVDGPMAAWIARVTPVDALLRTAATDLPSLLPAMPSVQLLAVLAAQRGRPEVARTLVDGYRVDAPAWAARFARFRDELTRRHPDVARAR